MKTVKEKNHILVIDDSPINIKLLGETLMSDYDISVSTNGPEGIELATSVRKPDLILLDIMMPVMDGYEVCRILKSDVRTKNIPIIFITAINEEDEETKGFRLGAVDYITKPFSPEIVKARVRTHLDLKLYRDHLEELVRKRTEDLQKSHEDLEKRVADRTSELSKSNALLTQEIIERKRSESALKENEEYLRTIMATIQTGVVIIDPRTRKIIDANPWASKMIGYPQNDLAGMECINIKDDNSKSVYLMPKFCKTVNGGDCTLETKENETIHVRRSFAKAIIRDYEYYVHSLLDITDIRQLLKKQEMNIDLAKSLLHMVNQPLPRYVPLDNHLTLFVESLSVPCYAEGGDHFFLRTFKDNPDVTLMSLKDQSGHEVSCVLRSIITDLVHNSILNKNSVHDLEKQITRLNDTICLSGTFNREDFFTLVTAALDHQSLMLKFLSAGHPPFLLIRGTELYQFPLSGGNGENVPVAFVPHVKFTSETVKLEPGDKMIFYTDGLTEMPLRNTNTMLSTDNLRTLITGYIEKHPNSSVSEITGHLLREITLLSHEEILSDKDKNGPKNTSGDDVTLLCLEIEDLQKYREMKTTPRNSGEVSDFINSTFELISNEWRKAGFHDPEVRLRMVLEEGILNAWVHGNRKKPERSIIVRWRFGNDFNLNIMDEGNGFDSCDIPDPTVGNNIVKPCGRGIFIINHFSDYAEWQNNGQNLYVAFAKQGIPEHKKQSKNILKLWE